MNSDPFAVGNGACGDNSLELLICQSNAKIGNQRIERRKGCCQVAQEAVDCHNHITGPHTDPIRWSSYRSDKSNLVVDQFNVADVTAVVTHVLC